MCGRARRFALAGFTSVLCRRSNQAGLDAAVQKIEEDGGCAKGYLLNIVSPGAIEGLVKRIELEVGEIEVAVYNLGAQIGNVPLESTSLKQFEMGWRLGCEGLFRLAQSVAPPMTERGHGALLVTSATAAVRGNRGQHSHAAAMGGRRMLCQTIADEYGPRGMHVCHFMVDGAVDAPDTLGRMLGPERFAQLRKDLGPDGMLSPASVAETYFHVYGQPRSVWTHELDLRPFKEVAWYNSRM